MDRKKNDRRQEQIERITVNETRLERCGEAVSALGQALSQYISVKEDLRKLEAYYGSPDWLTDKEMQESGALPEGLRCGVLSEDAVYDLLMEDGALKKALQALLSDEI